MAELNAADVLATQDGPVTTPNNPEDSTRATTATVGEELEPQGTQIEGDDEIEEGHGRRLGGWQRKIKKLEDQNEKLLNALTARGTPPVAPAKAAESETPKDEAPVKPARPRQADYDGSPGKTWEDWERALVKYEDEKDEYYAKLADHRAKLAVETDRAQREQKSEQQKVADTFQAQCETLRAEHPDFNQVAFSKDVAMSHPMMDAIVTSECGAAIAYELGSHPDEAERIANLSPVAAIREIGKIEARIASHTSVTEKDEDDAPVATTKAPKPPVPVRKTSASDQGLRDDIPYKDWVKRREAELNKRN